jgi:hypothetical protein
MEQVERSVPGHDGLVRVIHLHPFREVVFPFVLSRGLIEHLGSDEVERRIERDADREDEPLFFFEGQDAVRADLELGIRIRACFEEKHTEPKMHGILAEEMHGGIHVELLDLVELELRRVFGMLGIQDSDVGTENLKHLL